MNLLEMMMGQSKTPSTATPMATSMFGNLPYLELPQPTLPAGTPQQQQPQQVAAPPPQQQAPGAIGNLEPYNPYGMQEPPWGFNTYYNPNTGEMYRKRPMAVPGGPQLMPEQEWFTQYGR